MPLLFLLVAVIIKRKIAGFNELRWYCSELLPTSQDNAAHLS